MANKVKLILLFYFYLIGSGINAQISYEHISQYVNRYQLNGSDDENNAIFRSFLTATASAILFDFSNNKDQEYLFEQKFVSLFEQLNNHLVENPNEVKTLFFEGVSEVWVGKLLSRSGLSKRRYKHDSSEEWPSVKELSEKKKQLIVFFRDKSDSFTLVNGKYVFDSKMFEISEEVTRSGQLLFLNIQLPDEAVNNGLELPPGFVDSFIDLWKRTGQVPNFILLNGISFRQNIPLILNSTEKLYGNISFETASFGTINWAGNFISTTANTFCFPAYSGEKISLTPQTLGFSFEPAQLNFQGGDIEVVKLKSIKKKLTDGTMAYFPLEKDVNDLSPKELKGENNGIEFVSDYNRSKVAALHGKYFANLPSLKELNIVNESFTISTWIKLDSVDIEDQMIISSAQNKYSEGLYILVREKKPYFAFYHNDLEGKTTLESNKWYNIIWRYRKELQQQAIFINGRLDSIADGRPPLRGSGSLILGHRKNPTGDSTYFNGYMDDLIFWNRALGENEIRNVYEGNFELQSENDYTSLIWVVAGAFLIIVIVFMVGGQQKDVPKPKVGLVSKPSITSTFDISRNGIFFFGGLKVLAADGSDITNEITPKLKELFILLYLSTLRDKKGISSEELSTSIWPDLSRQSAINNRGVSTTKLRQILSKLDGIELKYSNQFWALEVDEDVYSDYQEFLNLTNSWVEDSIERLTTILNRGNFLPNISKEWLDPFKFETSNRVIDLYGKLLQSTFQKEALEQLINYCDIVLTFDVVHESAVKYKVAALKKQKKHEQALKQYQAFTKTYKQFYNEDFVTPFTEFIP
ncbi:MAG: hypothetical protein JXQ96_14725 [Cyclobacteriaceae bacterium]